MRPSLPQFHQVRSYFGTLNFISLTFSLKEVGISLQDLAPNLENALNWICNFECFMKKLREAAARALYEYTVLVSV